MRSHRDVQPDGIFVEPLEPRLLLDGSVMISEFMARNDSTLIDGDGQYSDWLEVHNPTAEAVDLTGWRLRDGGDTWVFPAASLGPGEFKVIFASDGRETVTDVGKDPNWDGQYFHTNFKLKGGGEYLGLLNDLGAVVHEYDEYPQQFEDLSYGIAQNIETTEYVAPGDTASYHVPTGAGGDDWTAVGFNAAAWSTGETALGFADTVAGFAVHNYKANTTVSTLGTAEQVISTPSMQSAVHSANDPLVNYNNSQASGHYGGDTDFPGFTAIMDDFVVEATGFVTIPTAGQWTFGVNSDDGFGLTIPGVMTSAVYNATNAAGTDTLEFANPRGTNDTLGVFEFPLAGTYELRLVFYERGGGAGMEMFAAPGARTGFDPAVFRLVGDTAGGGLAVVSVPVTGGQGGGSFTSQIKTDVEAVMKGVNASMFVRVPFTVADPALIQSLTLKMKYDDGYVAYLNGEPIVGAAKNAPATPLWNSAATASRTDAQATTWENVTILDPSTLLLTGPNVLAIHAMNATAGDGDFLVMPQLAEITYLGLGEHYFAIATPADANTDEYWLYVEDTKFDHDRGFYDAPFDVTITTGTEGADIYYTTDGSAPSDTNGTLFVSGSPIHISTTTTLRAVALKALHAPSDVDTQTYIFLDDVMAQPSNPLSFPTSWGSEPADYEMDPTILADPFYSDTLKDDLLSLPTMSIVMDMDDLFGPNGIYTLSNSQGIERPASLEYFDPLTDDDFQVNAGARIYGGVGRQPRFKKHSFRFLFKEQYGPTKLKFPLFGEDATDSFDTIILRSNFNDAWVWGGAPTQFIRDEFMGQLQLALDEPGRHGTFVHLYINGLYWGLYNPVERPDTSFSATYFGGDKANWDGINSTQPTGESQTTAWNELMNQSPDLADNAAYQKVQGLNLDGTNNPTYEDYLDIDNYITFLLINFYGGNNDWVSHNWYAGRERGPNSTGFKSYSWDAEWVIDMRSGLNDNAVGDAPTANYLLKPYTYLRNNAEFKLRFADEVHKAMFNGGALTPEFTIPLYQSMADLVEQSVKAETVRWGDVVREPAYDLDDWTNERDYILNTYLPQRTGIVLQQIKDAGLYPDLAAPVFSINGSAQHGGLILPGDTLTMASATAVTYYTLDGTDPRELYGAVSPAAVEFTPGASITLNNSTHVKSRTYDSGTGTWSALNEGTFYIDLAPDIRITEMMYNPSDPTLAEIAAGFIDSDDFEYIEIKNISTTETLPLAGLRLTNGINFTFGDVSIAPGAYLVVVGNRAAFEFRYSGFSGTIAGEYGSGIVDGTQLSNGGERVRLDSPIGGIIHDFAYKDGWYDHTDGDGFSLTIRDPLGASDLWALKDGWRASAAPGGTPGYDDVLTDPEAVIINEVLAHSDSLVYDAIELYNTSTSPVDISGWFLSDARKDDLGNSTLTKYQIPAMAPLAPGAYVVFYEHTSFGTGAGAFFLSELGDDVYLSSNAGGVAGGYREHVDFGASPADIPFGLFVKSTAGTDFALLTAPTLGSPNATPFFDDIVINEIMYHPASPTTGEIAAGYNDRDMFEFIELYNSSATTTRTLSDFYLSNGVGFTFGWYDADGLARESWTLEPGATATWNAALPAGSASYEVFARWDLLDGEGDARDLDGQARYAITHSAGTANVIRDQKPELDDEGPDYIDAEGWVSLGTYTFDAAGQVVLTRGTNNPGNWTIADQVKFVSASHTEVVDNPTLDSWYTANGPATIAPGGYVVIVSNRDAFDARYDIAGNSIPVVGQYTGNLSNGGEKVKLMRRGNPEPAPSYFIPYYRVDYANYTDHMPWPSSPDGSGPSLNRIDPATPYPYGNDPASWASSATDGSPGQANIFEDETPPTVPQNVSALVSLLLGTRIELTWSASSDPGSYVDHYVIYRDGDWLGTSSTTDFSDAAVELVTPYGYQVAAVNRDGHESARSAATTITIPGIASWSAPAETEIKLVFSEPVQEAPAEELGNYTFSGGTLLGATLEADNITVTLTTTPLVVTQDYSVIIVSLPTVSGLLMPAGQEVAFTYAAEGEGFILREWWTGIGGTAVANLTGNANYPDNPTGWDLPTLFEGPVNWAENYGTRMRGYVHPPVSGNYTFWIATDDGGELWLSTDNSPANVQRIAWIDAWAGSRVWERYATQKSVEIYLAAGQRYYIDAFQKEQGGGDNIAVRWQLPGGVWEDPADPGAPIPGNRLSPWVDPGADLTPPTAPGAVAAVAASSTQINVTWTAATDDETGIDHYVVSRNGVEIATPGSAALGFNDTTADQAQTYTYTVMAVNGAGLEGPAGQAAPLSPPPSLQSVGAANQTQVLVTFGEPVTQASAEAVANYAITFGAAASLGISAAIWDAANPNLVMLALQGFLAEGTTYTLALHGVEDTTGNMIAPDSNMQFEYTEAWTFDANADGFTYADNTFNGTTNSGRATGNYDPTGGDVGGGLRVYLGPRSQSATSGGWSRSFQITSTGTAEVSLRYRMRMGEGYESNEYGEVILEIDSARYGTGANNSIVHVTGNGNGGGNDDTGWRTATFDVPLTAGQHTITIGAYNNRCTANDEWVEAFIDTVAVSVGNNAPIIVNPIPRVDVFEDDPNTVLDLSGVFSDSDADDALTFSVTGNSKPQTIATSVDGTDLTLSYLLDQNGAAAITVRATDLAGAWVEDTFIVVIAPVSDDPIANDDPKDAFEDTPLVFPASDLLANDVDVDRTGLTVDSVTPTADTHGTVALDGGIVTYTPETDYNGPASFTYTVSDADGSSDTATVNVTIEAVNEPPVATDDDKALTEDGGLAFPAADLLVNDTDPDSPLLTVTDVVPTAETHGMLLLIDGMVAYSPDPNYFGLASFDYIVSDGDGGTDTGTVDLAIAGTFDDPVARDDFKDATEDVTLLLPTADLLDNDLDIDNAGLTVTGVAITADTHGLVALTDQTVAYTPDLNYNGPASFTYTIASGNGGGDTTTVHVTVTPVNDDPDATDDDKSTPQDLSLFFPATDLLSNDTDVDSVGLTVTGVAATPETHGLVALVDGTVVYTPEAGYNGPADFTYTVSDGDGGADTATVNVTVGSTVSATPSGVDLLAPTDTGASATDDVTNLDNHDAASALQFEVAGTVGGATVRVYADGIEIGTAVAGAATTTVITNGAVDLADTSHVITATQTETGKSTSAPSAALSITVDTVAPTVTSFGLLNGDWQLGTIDSSAWLTGRSAQTVPWPIVSQLVLGFDEPVSALAGDLTLDGVTHGLITAVAVAGSGTDVVTWTATPVGQYLADDRFAVALPATVADGAGNGLTGGWTADLNVLGGDITGDGRVSSRDRRDLRDAYGSSTGSGNYIPFADLNADGRISSRDRRALRDAYGSSLLPLPIPPDADAQAAAAALTPQAAPAGTTGDDDDAAPPPTVAEARSAALTAPTNASPSTPTSPAAKPSGAPADGDDASSPAQLEPDLSPGLTDPLTGTDV